MESLRKEVASYHHGDLRNALIQAGLEILRTSGAHKLSLREAARTAGVSQAAPYRHFTNKEALLAAVAQEGFVILGGLLRKAVEDHADNPEEQFHQIALAYLQLAIEHEDHFKLMFGAVTPIHPENHPDLDRMSQDFFRQILEIVSRCQSHGVLREGDPESIALSAWSSFHGFTWLLVNHNLAHKVEPLAMMRSLSRQLLDGLKAI